MYAAKLWVRVTDDRGDSPSTNMLAIVLIDHRLALVALAALLILAAAPLAYAWARLFPEEQEPFGVAGAGAEPEDLASNGKTGGKKDPLAVFLLVCVTLSYLLRFPGLPLSAGLQWFSTLLPVDYFQWAVLGARAFFVVVPGLAAVYSALRPNPIRIALTVGGLLVLALWLLSPVLRAAIATT
jgi:hypothetical protein